VKYLSKRPTTNLLLLRSVIHVHSSAASSPFVRNHSAVDAIREFFVYAKRGAYCVCIYMYTYVIMSAGPRVAMTSSGEGVSQGRSAMVGWRCAVCCCIGRRAGRAGAKRFAAERFWHSADHQARAPAAHLHTHTHTHVNGSSMRYIYIL